MKILVHDYVGHPFQAQLSRELARRGHRVTHATAANILTPQGVLQIKPGDAPTLDFIQVPMSPDIRTNKYNFLKRRGYEVAYGHELAKTVRNLRPEIVLSGNTPTEPQWNMIQTATAMKLPVITWLQDFYSLAVDKLARKKLPVIGAMAGAWYRYVDGKSLRGAAGIVAITEDFLPTLQSFGVSAGKVTVIPNWAPLDELPTRPRQNAWSARHSLDDKFVFHYSGTLAMKHNPDLLRQLALHFQSDPAVRIVVISEGPGAEYLRASKARENLANLEILPFQPFTDMPDILATADVLTAVLEADAGVFSVPSKVLSYHCAGRPILAAIPSRNLAARIIGTENSGLCVEPDDIKGFVAQAVILRADAGLRQKQSQAARRYAEAHFDINIIADRFEVVFQKAMQSAGKSLVR